MDILVANPTYHLYKFHYRVPEFTRPLELEIPPGSQVKVLPGDFNEEQMKNIVEQLQRYGGVDQSDIASVTHTKSLVFSIRKPISSDKIDEAREQDGKVRQELADKETENSGVATIPPSLPASTQEVMRKTQQNSTLQVQQIESLENERSVRGGVDTTITVSKKAGARERRTG